MGNRGHNRQDSIRATGNGAATNKQGKGKGRGHVVHGPVHREATGWPGGHPISFVICAVSCMSVGARCYAMCQGLFRG